MKNRIKSSFFMPWTPEKTEEKMKQTEKKKRHKNIPVNNTIGKNFAISWGSRARKMYILIFMCKKRVVFSDDPFRSDPTRTYNIVCSCWNFCSEISCLYGCSKFGLYATRHNFCLACISHVFFLSTIMSIARNWALKHTIHTHLKSRNAISALLIAP